MVKYFSSILSKFTPKQRVFVITLLLLALVVVTLGPFIIKGYRPDNLELRKRLTQIESDNVSLNKMVSTLNNTVIKNQQECTNMLIDREKDIVNQLTELEKKYSAKQPIVQDKIMSVVADSTDLGVQPSQGEIPVMFVTDDKTKTLLSDIRKIKKGIQNRTPLKTN